MKRNNRYIEFLKKSQVRNREFYKEGKYRIITETNDAYVIENGTEIPKDDEDDMYVIKYIKNPDYRD